MSLVNESVKQILAEVDKFFQETVKAEKLSKKAQEHRQLILDKLTKLFEENPYLRVTPVDTSKGKENQDESLFTGGSTKSDGSEESAYIDYGIPVTPASELQNAAFTGNLEKKQRKGTGFFGSAKLQTRWCVIHGGNFYYYVKPDDKKQCGCFKLEGYKFRNNPDITKSKKEKELAFELYSDDKSKRVYQFVATSRADYENLQTVILYGGTLGEGDELYEPIENEVPVKEEEEYTDDISVCEVSGTETQEVYEDPDNSQPPQPETHPPPPPVPRNIPSKAGSALPPLPPTPIPHKTTEPPPVVPESEVLEEDELYEDASSINQPSEKSSDTPPPVPPPPPSRGAPPQLPRSEPLATRRLPPTPVEESLTPKKEEPATPKKKKIKLNITCKPEEDFENRYLGKWDCKGDNPKGDGLYEPIQNVVPVREGEYTYHISVNEVSGTEEPGVYDDPYNSQPPQPETHTPPPPVPRNMPRKAGRAPPPLPPTPIPHKIPEQPPVVPEPEVLEDQLYDDASSIKQSSEKFSDTPPPIPPPPPSGRAQPHLPRSKLLATRQLPPTPVEESQTQMKDEPATPKKKKIKLNITCKPEEDFENRYLGNWDCKGDNPKRDGLYEPIQNVVPVKEGEYTYHISVNEVSGTEEPGVYDDPYNSQPPQPETHTPPPPVLRNMPRKAGGAPPPLPTTPIPHKITKPPPVVPEPEVLDEVLEEDQLYDDASSINQSSEKFSDTPPPIPTPPSGRAQPQLPRSKLLATRQLPPTPVEESQTQMKDEPATPKKKKIKLNITCKPEEDFENRYLGNWDCKGDNPSELTFKRGDIIYILSRGFGEKSWWVGELNGKFGLVPKTFLTPAYTPVF